MSTTINRNSNGFINGLPGPTQEAVALLKQRAQSVSDDFHTVGSGNLWGPSHTANVAGMETDVDIITKNDFTNDTGGGYTLQQKQAAAEDLAQRVVNDQGPNGEHKLSPGQVADIENMLDEVGVHLSLTPGGGGQLTVDTSYNNNSNGQDYTAQKTYNAAVAPGTSGTTPDDSTAETLSSATLSAQ